MIRRSAPHPGRLPRLLRSVVKCLLPGCLAAVLGFSQAPVAGAQMTAEERAQTLQGLSSQRAAALSEELSLNRETRQLQAFRATSFGLLTRLSGRETPAGKRVWTEDDLRRQALRRYVSRDLSASITAVNAQLAPLDELRRAILRLHDAVETLRSTAVMEGDDLAMLRALEAGPRLYRDPEAPRPEGVYDERQADFRTLPALETAKAERPLILPLARPELAFRFEADDPDDAARLFHKGLQLLAEKGAKVSAPFEGKIAYAAPYRSFGNLVVIEHEGGGATLLAGVHSFAISVGEWVRQGAVVGRMPSDSPDKPRLYFEFRIDQVPIDPLALVGSITDE